MSQSELLSAWDSCVDWIAYDLMKEGTEAIIFQPLGKFPTAATTISETEFSSDNYKRRKVGATIAQYMIPADKNLLERYFGREKERDLKNASDLMERLYSQSVMEDIVFAAARWCRSDATRVNGLTLLEQVVNNTLEGVYWNTSNYAMATLMFHNAIAYEPLLRKYAAYVQTATSDHPSRPSYENERKWASGLIQKDPGVVRAIENYLDGKLSVAQQTTLAVEERRLLELLLKRASEFTG